MSMKDQLDCGARAFDYRPRQASSTDVVRAQHNSFCPVETPMATSVQSVIDWLVSNPTELVILYVSHFQGYSDCDEECLKNAAEAVLDSKGVYTVRGIDNGECEGLAGLTIGQVKALSALGTDGHLFAVFGSAGVEATRVWMSNIVALLHAIMNPVTMLPLTIICLKLPTSQMPPMPLRKYRETHLLGLASRICTKVLFVHEKVISYHLTRYFIVFYPLNPPLQWLYLRVNYME